MSKSNIGIGLDGGAIGVGLEIEEDEEERFVDDEREEAVGVEGRGGILEEDAEREGEGGGMEEEEERVVDGEERGVFGLGYI